MRIDTSKMKAAFAALAAALLIFSGCATRSDDDPTGFRVIAVSPSNGQSNVSTTATIMIRFSEPPDHQTVIGTNQIILADQSNAIVPVSFQFQGENLVLTPASPLASSATYGIAVRPGVRDIYGDNVEQPYAALFSTGTAVGSIPNWPPFTFNAPVPAPSFPSGTFTMVGQLWQARMRHEAMLLDDGKVLVCGGLTTPAVTSATRSAEVYNPASRTWAISKSNNNRGMHFVRYDHTLLKLTSGHVLVIGGGDNVSIWDTCEEYNPITDNFSLWGARLQNPRAGHTSALLANGNPIVIGGVDNTGATLSSMEVFDQTTNTWVYTSKGMGSLGAMRAFHNTVTLSDGSLLNAGANMNNADIYFPGSGAGTNGIGQFTGTLMPSGHSNGASDTLITSGYGAGLVVIIGGFRVDWYIDAGFDFAQLYDHSQVVTTPAINGNRGAWTPVGQTMFHARHFHTANRLPSGKIVVAGGYIGRGPTPPPASRGNRQPNLITTTAEVFDPFGLGYNVNAPFNGIDVTGRFTWTRNAAGTQTTIPNLITGVTEHTATTLLDGTVLLAGGADYVFPAAFTIRLSYIYKD